MGLAIAHLIGRLCGDDLCCFSKTPRFFLAKKPATLTVETFEIGAGERVFLHGSSGSGKSTLLGLICGILKPASGQLIVLGEDMSTASQPAKDALRARDLGIVFQMFNLLPFLNVRQNVLLGCQFSSARRSRIDAGLDTEAVNLLSRLGLEGDAVLSRRVSDLSVGQQQRVAVARALLGSPKLVIADEPTSALDAQARKAFMDVLFSEIQRTKAALIMVSHDGALASGFDRSINLAELNQAQLPEGVS